MNGHTQRELPGGPDQIVVTPEDPRYEQLIRGENYRFVAKPDYIRLARTASDVERAVADAVAAGKRLVVRSGGHCGEDFAANPDVEVIIDLSLLTDVRFDPDRDAFLIEPGATLGRIYGTLLKDWGVTIPAGTCMSVAAGGHISGGGLGPMSRQFGLTVDHLEAVEVVVVAEDGSVSSVIATRDEDDPHHDLWWAHTGGGGGNFGVVTKYWLRTPGVTSTDPADLLPRPPALLHVAKVSWPWERLTESAFHRLVRNFLDWHLANSDVDTPFAGLYAYLECFHRCNGTVTLTVQASSDMPDATGVLTRFLDAVGDRVGVTPAVTRIDLPWLAAAWYLTPPDSGPGAIGVRRKVKSADLRAAHTDEQIATVYRHLTGPAITGMGYVEYMGYGGVVNAVPSEATARADRRTLVKTFYNTFWTDPADDDAHLGWLQEMYRDIHRESGGVPVPGEANTGAYINYPDVDLADPNWNTSGVPWHTLYYGANYPRLQRIKAAWDPRNVFHHALSVRPA
ncbi:BBE domain-containing protein [Actinosynnema sp. NPDC023587]|uniref:FAD-binding oxidoreductase n=1 Tax=Actinosynnema sp. NPDC023587 TaxID=3154695 RepID=UPI0033E62574